MSIQDVKRNDPSAAAAYYRARRRAGTWHPHEAEALYMLQDTDELQDELAQLIAAADTDLEHPT